MGPAICLTLTLTLTLTLVNARGRVGTETYQLEIQDDGAIPRAGNERAMP